MVEMLNYTKMILEKVSFNSSLFKKELLKSLQWLTKEEFEELKFWCMITFTDKYNEILT